MRWLAATTESLIAKFRPWAPTGELVCAASPSNNNPGRLQRSTRSDTVLSKNGFRSFSLTWLRWLAIAESACSAIKSIKCGVPIFRNSRKLPFFITKPNCILPS